MSAKRNYKRDSKKSRKATPYVPQGNDLCQTPPYAILPLLPYLNLEWTLWEAAKGEGLMVDAFYDRGFEHIVGGDIMTGENFFDYEPEQWDVHITNPPFSLKFLWLERCYNLGKPFSLLLPVEVLGTTTLQELMKRYGFELMLLDQRVDFKMPKAGWKGGGAQFPVFWFCWHLLPQQVMIGSFGDEKKAFKDGNYGQPSV